MWIRFGLNRSFGQSLNSRPFGFSGMDKLLQNHAAGISLVAFVVAAAASISYYQFTFVPEAGKKPLFQKEVVQPEDTARITIAQGASNENNGEFYVPGETRVVLGISNRVVWHNSDSVAHTVTADDGYVDSYSDLFDSLARPGDGGGPYIMPGDDFEFLFTEAGEFPYHCEPHPHMGGKIVVVEDFS
jgi:plastocyanin